MTYSLSLRPRALAEIEDARDAYELVEHGTAFLAEVEAVLEAIGTMPMRFPAIHGPVRRALLRRYPFAVFFRIRPGTQDVVILAVLPQRGAPSKWPRR